MRIDKKILQDVVNNARIRLNKEEEEELLGQLNDVLKIFSRLSEANTDKIEPSFQPIEVKNVFRQDVVKPCKEDVLANIKHKEDGYFKGPKAL